MEYNELLTSLQNNLVNVDEPSQPTVNNEQISQFTREPTETNYNLMNDIGVEIQRQGGNW